MEATGAADRSYARSRGRGHGLDRLYAARVAMERLFGLKAALPTSLRRHRTVERPCSAKETEFREAERSNHGAARVYGYLTNAVRRAPYCTNTSAPMKSQFGCP